ncbi:hypothetical protein [Halosimplex halobium]|uniref:hypothetical protein n=1 Tax=Halosimplex halobium TaxID=3396618 RepID=UPI003F56EA55
MSLATAAGVCLSLAAVSTLVTVARHGRPGPKRTHFFEDDDGERANPFADLSAGTEAAAAACRDCGAPLASETYRYCGGCETGSRPLADD